MIDWSRMKSPEAVAGEVEVAVIAAQMAECRERILSVLSETTQMNLTAAAAGGMLSPEEAASYRAGLAWIGAMRAAWRRVPAVWPEVPDGVAALARRF